MVGWATTFCVYLAGIGFQLGNYWTTVVTGGVICGSEAARERAPDPLNDLTSGHTQQT
jgi:hypothetical protein